MGEDLARTVWTAGGWGRGAWPRGLFQHKEVTSDGGQSLLVTFFLHAQRSCALTPVLFGLFVSHSAPPLKLARDGVSHSLPMSPSVASQQKDPRLCWLRPPACLVWERAWALRLRNLGSRPPPRPPILPSSHPPSVCEFQPLR